MLCANSLFNHVCDVLSCSCLDPQTTQYSQDLTLPLILFFSPAFLLSHSSSYLLAVVLPSGSFPAQLSAPVYTSALKGPLSPFRPWTPVQAPPTAGPNQLPWCRTGQVGLLGPASVCGAQLGLMSTAVLQPRLVLSPFNWSGLERPRLSLKVHYEARKVK